MFFLKTLLTDVILDYFCTVIVRSAREIGRSTFILWCGRLRVVSKYVPQWITGATGFYRYTVEMGGDVSMVSSVC